MCKYIFIIYCFKKKILSIKKCIDKNYSYIGIKIILIENHLKGECSQIYLHAHKEHFKIKTLI